MFSSGSPYSPFFTSGLLSSTECPSSSSYPPAPRRGSLPTDSLSPREPTTPVDHSAAFYFNLQPKRDQKQYRSFLSLDLAESQSMRSASLKRKASSNAHNSCPCSRLSEVPVPSSRLRFSRDSLRSMPSPKPAPSINLPELPSTASAPPRLPSLPKLPSIYFAPEPARRSFLSSLRISRTKAPSSFSTSSISTRAKRGNRSDALARLEGRSMPPPALKSAPPFQLERNFMSMSDDEDDDSDVDSSAPKNDVSEDDLFYAFFEPEDLVLPPSPTSRRKSSSPTKPSFRRSLSKRSTSDWFPLKSFIDLKNDDESSTWSWRSFIDVASIS
ncbi:hypothetical protein FA15DRAFT_663944 [Coprinopsis marcescibilis]|uniref:Uncharacterized protein n=1 Tax=Coprinopsis marcescibilis TaxID=230819 RepID=A0A5C3LAR2_COPMA|nr:hypothetical protein FA15DRAFT_663944 [Coprinopsis marcescibilis]